jgi:hypothetical protein
MKKSEAWAAVVAPRKRGPMARVSNPAKVRNQSSNAVQSALLNDSRGVGGWATIFGDGDGAVSAEYFEDAAADDNADRTDAAGAVGRLAARCAKMLHVKHFRAPFAVKSFTEIPPSSAPHLTQTPFACADYAVHNVGEWRCFPP